MKKTTLFSVLFLMLLVSCKQNPSSIESSGSDSDSTVVVDSLSE